MGEGSQTIDKESLVLLNVYEVLNSLQSTLNDDGTLCGLLLSSGKGRVYIGSNFPKDPPERFLSVFTFPSIQDIQSTELEFTTVGVTIGVLATHDSNEDLDILSQLADRVNTLVHNTPSALTLTNDLIGHISREGSLPPDTDLIGEEDFLIARERFELLTTTKG